MRKRRGFQSRVPNCARSAHATAERFLWRWTCRASAIACEVLARGREVMVRAQTLISHPKQSATLGEYAVDFIGVDTVTWDRSKEIALIHGKHTTTSVTSSYNPWLWQVSKDSSFVTDVILLNHTVTHKLFLMTDFSTAHASDNGWWK